MAVNFRKYTAQAGITDDYFKVRKFLIDLGYKEYTYARWDWMTTHTYLDPLAVGSMGLWEEDENIVGAALIDGAFGQAFCLTLPGYEDLKRDMLIHAENHMSKDGQLFVTIDDHDPLFQQMAAESGFVATPNKEFDAIFVIDQTSLDYTLPEGFQIQAMSESLDLEKYGKVLWKGFDHERNGEGPFIYNDTRQLAFENEMIRPNVDLSLKIAVTNPHGDYVAYCGMWYDPQAGFAVVEPVATDPDYRKLGLGKAAVLEGIFRCKQRGATLAFVGSSQQFYYNIGFRPYATATQWTLKNYKSA